ncbi:MAG: UMP kinase [Verrucomicrobia bacterium]|nr:UMP kinase [Verrucomicrobiota bacterium]
MTAQNLTSSYRRVLLKLSGESLGEHGISGNLSKNITLGIKDLVDQGIEVGIVVGGGNIFRGHEGAALGISKIAADQMGMLATCINAIALQQSLEQLGIEAHVMSAINCQPIAEAYNPKEAIRHLERKGVVIFAGGTGNPYFTTDTAAALRACEIEADILLKATKVNGIYSKDPLTNPDAVRYEKISYADVLAQKLEVMDATAIALCMSNKIPILVFNMAVGTKFSDVLINKQLGTVVY